MRTYIRALCASLIAAVLVCAAPPRDGVPESKPKLILTIVVDQFRYDYLTRYRSHYRGAFAQMWEKAAIFTNAHYEHFPTVTAIGHATVLTGATPSISGIVGNEWYDRETRKQVSSVSDDSVKLLGGNPTRAAASPHRLLVSTVADELKMSGKPSRAFGVSLKDRSAILPTGRMADGAFWFDNSTGNFVSSTYYFPDLPAWVKDFNASRTIDKYAGKQWADSGGAVLRTMPAKAEGSFWAQMQTTPFGNEIVAAFAIRALEAERLGQGEGTDVLSVSFSSNDYVGHSLGPDSPEARDISLRTDVIIGEMLAAVDKSVGLGKTIIVFTADHGVAPMPEVMQKRKMPGGRMPEGVVHNAVQTRLTQKYGAGNWVIGKSGPAPYLNYDLIKQKNLSIEEVQRTAAEVVRDIPNIFRVYTREQLRNGQLLEDRVGRRVRNGFHNQRGSDLFVIVNPYWLFEAKGTSHGTPFNYDSHVPVVFMGPGIKPGLYHRPVAVNDIAPTLATLLEVETPSGAEGRVLEEMLIK